MITLYGIANCDTIRRARRWLAAKQIAFDFHDYRKQGLPPELLEAMAGTLGWEAMLNRRGTTWRALPDEVRDHIDRDSALRIMLDNPAVIKRPILAHGGDLHLGFSDAQYREIFGLA